MTKRTKTAAPKPLETPMIGQDATGQATPTDTTKPQASAVPGADGKLRLEWVDAETLTPNPGNWRRHGKQQVGAFREVFHKVGWAGAGLLNDRQVMKGWKVKEAVPTLIDGHMRRKEAMAQKESMPVLVGSWTPEQERAILATLDPIASMAEADGQALAELLKGMEAQEDGLKELLRSLNDSVLATAPYESLDTLAEQYGEGASNDFAPVIRIEVTSEIKQLFDSYMGRIEGKDDGERFGKLLAAVNLANIPGDLAATETERAV